jgi:hypothetical protein
VNEGIDLITWTVTGKVSEVMFCILKRTTTSLSVTIPWATGLPKYRSPKTGQTNHLDHHLVFARCSGQRAGRVQQSPGFPELPGHRVQHLRLFRIGMVTQPEALNETPQVPLAHSQTLGLKVYEFSNHLGNVLTTFSDRKIATEGNPGYVAYYTAEILSSTDYYPFGFEMPGRVYEGNYRYGFQGQEGDPEVHGSKSTSIYFKYRIHDTRIGRFLSVAWWKKHHWSYRWIKSSPYKNWNSEAEMLKFQTSFLGQYGLFPAINTSLELMKESSKTFSFLSSTKATRPFFDGSGILGKFDPQTYEISILDRPFDAAYIGTTFEEIFHAGQMIYYTKDFTAVSSKSMVEIELEAKVARAYYGLPWADVEIQIGGNLYAYFTALRRNDFQTAEAFRNDQRTLEELMYYANEVYKTYVLAKEEEYKREYGEKAWEEFRNANHPNNLDYSRILEYFEFSITKDEEK